MPTRSTRTIHHHAVDFEYRISTALPPEMVPGGFTSNQFLPVDESPLLFHTGMRTLFCGVLFTQGGAEHEPLAENIFETSEQMRAMMEYYARGANTAPVLERLAGLAPHTLACMHGSAYRGDGASLLRDLAKRVG